MRNGKTSLVSCTSIIFRLKQSIKFTFCAFCSWENKKSYQTFFYYDAYYIQHLQLHVLQFPFKIVVMMTQLVLSIFCCLLYFSFWLHILTHSLSYSYILFLYGSNVFPFSNKNIAYLMRWLIRMGDLVCLLLVLFI